MQDGLRIWKGPSLSPERGATGTPNPAANPIDSFRAQASLLMDKSRLIFMEECGSPPCLLKRDSRLVNGDPTLGEPRLYVTWGSSRDRLPLAIDCSYGVR